MKNLSAVALTNSMSSVAINPVPNSMIGSKPKKKCFGASNALTMRCDEKFRLVMECTEAAEKYSDSVLDLNARSGVSAHEEYTEQKRVVDDCRAALELARLALDRHISIHGCGRADEFLN